MFKDLTNFKLRRTNKEAFGFYLAYLVLIIVIGFCLGSFMGLMSFGVDMAYNYGTLAAVVSLWVLSYAILKAKKINSFGMIFVGVLSGALGLIGGALLGLIPVAYLTTRK